ncbi:hypothetical protein [Pararhodospirillum photometricum]|uniref:Uncharacterized protein n=1 Tax=Pararhodospirillum photometricum DSM 122 TaxID=1150469 RepID=H6SQA8_PARPM|nr:hypothetical protein [Pararhodospirillum photometricum]CCG09627.1 Putative uncharacterized protein [Pararhodospirillum photometricum DSM 122]
MAVTPKVTSSTTTYASAANTRLGDGIRATASPQAFSPITETPVSAEVSLKDQGLRNDEWGSKNFLPNREETASHDNGAYYSSRQGYPPVRLGAILASNDVSRIVFSVQLRPTTAPAARYLSGGIYASRDAAGIYDSNTRVVHARFSGRKDPGGVVDRLL